MDSLKAMFELQRALQLRLKTPLIGEELRERNMPFANLDRVQQLTLTRWHKEFSLALMMEASELMDWSAWKHWSERLGNKQDVAMFSLEHRSEVALEIVDCFHFLINISLLWGITPNELFAIFTEKNAVNHSRQESGSY